MRQVAANVLAVCALGATLGTSDTAGAEQAEVELSARLEQGREALALGFEAQGESRAILYLDARLATVELHDESRRLGRCRAPAGAVRPGEDPRRFVALEPGARAVERLDLRYLCFGRDLARLESATRAVVDYQARARHDPRGRPVQAGRLGPVELELPAPAGTEGTPSASQGAAEEGRDREPPLLSIRQVGPAPDAADGSRVPVTVELSAPPRARVPVLVRSDQLAFEVRTPDGSVFGCGLPPAKIRPLREFFDQLGRRRVAVDLARLCQPEALAAPGIYLVTPRFESTFDGAEVGLEAWTGSVEGPAFLVRVRRASRARGEPVQIEWPARSGPGERAREAAEDAR